MSETQIKRKDNYIFRKIVKEMVLVPVKQDVAEMEYIFTLNEVGAYIWDKLSQATTVEEVEQAVVAAFDVDPAVAEEDIHLFLEELKALDALERG